MTKEMPRIASISVVGRTRIDIEWKDGGSDHVDLAGWIATGGDTLSLLQQGLLFATATVGIHGAAVVWDEDKDLAIDAYHLKLIADAQRSMDAADITAWQEEMGLSNHEAAEFLRIAPSSWSTYKAGSQPVPRHIAMLCQAARRDPVFMEAYYRPRKSGRPTKAA